MLDAHDEIAARCACEAAETIRRGSFSSFLHPRAEVCRRVLEPDRVQNARLVRQERRTQFANQLLLGIPLGTKSRPLRDTLPVQTGGVTAGMCYADIGIRPIMPKLELCRIVPGCVGCSYDVAGRIRHYPGCSLNHWSTTIMTDKPKTCVDPYVDSFAQSFAAANYTAETIRTYRHLARKLGRLMDTAGIVTLGIDPRPCGSTGANDSARTRHCDPLSQSRPAVRRASDRYRSGAAGAVDRSADRASGIAGGL